MAGAPRAAVRGDELVGVGRAAALLGVHPNTIRAWCHAGRLPAYRINARGDRRFRRADLVALLRQLETDDPGRDHAVDDAPAEERHRRQLSVLARLAEAAATARSLEDACRLAGRALLDEMRYRGVAIHVADGPALRCCSSAGSLAGAAELPAEPVDRVAAMTSRRKQDGVLRLPVRAGDELLGLLTVVDDRPEGPPAEDGEFLRGVANQLAVTFRGARLLARLEEALTRSEALRVVAAEISSTLDLDRAFSDVIEYAKMLFGADRVGLWTVEPGPRPFRYAAGHGLSERFRERIAELTLDSRTLGVRALREQQVQLVRDASTDDAIGALGDVYAADGIATVCLIPLLHRGEALGVLGVYHGEPHDWPDHELELARSFATQMATAIQNARLYHSISNQAARLRSIHDLGVRLGRLTDVKELGEAIVAEAGTLAAYHDIRVYVVDAENSVCEPVAFSDRAEAGHDFDREQLRVALRVPVGVGLTGWVAEHGEPILCNDALADPRSGTIPGTEDVDESLLVVPMMFEASVLGVIVLSKLGKHQFDADDLQTMTIFAGYAAQAIANATAYERLERQSAELERQLVLQRRLLEINERLVSTLDRSGVLELIADGLHSVVWYQNLSIYRLDRETSLLVPVLAREEYADEVAAYPIPVGRGLLGWAAEHREAQLVNDALADPRAIQIPGTSPDPEAVIVVPLFADGEVSGAMNVGRVGREEVQFTSTDFDLVKLFAAQASVALRNVEAHHEVALRADTDALTGLGNHGAFQRQLGVLLATGSQLAILMMDLDNFKRFNDRYGHPAGDALLHAVALTASSAARASDRLFRYGGDEFAAILPGADAAAAAAVGERIRAAVAETTTDEAPASVTITIGVGAAPSDATAKDALIAAADAALYTGKRTGENRVVRADALPDNLVETIAAAAGERTRAGRGRKQRC